MSGQTGKTADGSSNYCDSAHDVESFQFDSLSFRFKGMIEIKFTVRFRKFTFGFKATVNFFKVLTSLGIFNSTLMGMLKRASLDV